jgi:Protein of unknown function (DUF1553)/Protein of unknown function (DUF1549)
VPRWSFRNHVLPVLTKAGCNSGACHGASAGKGGLKLTLRGYDPAADYATLTRQALGRRIVKTEPGRSLILLKPTMQVPHGGGERFKRDSLEYRVLAEWIADGTPPPQPTDPTLRELEVQPAAVTAATGQTESIRVRAHFSDGHTEDVTRWVKYGTSDAGVATVGDDGTVKVQGSGEAAITVWYLSRVAFARVSSPFPDPPPAERFAQAPRRGFIDEIVLKKLQTLGIPRSGVCSDSEFIRRAFLDATGVLPTPAEVQRFLADPSPEKRAKLIDALLARPEFVDYWTYKWSDLLLVSSRKISPRAVRTFSNWVRGAVASNLPWDRFARELVTARGSTLENGAANYFVLHKDPISLTETTSQAFLGMSITCARCHNHPLEKWTQNDYYRMANLFARVTLKNGDQPGEALVLAANSGNINHPRTGRPLAPRPLDGPEMPLDAPGDRREHLAAWLTSPENPYFSRAIVNRVWRNFMGRGLVEAEDDLRLTNPPSNEELLSAVARDFASQGFDVRRLIRTIMNSATYQLSSTPEPGNAADTKFYSHYLVRRLPAEVILDAISQVTSVPQEFPGYPKGTRALQLPDSQVASYFLTAFGRPERVQTCACERQQEPSIPQALHLSNGDTINQKLRAPGGTIDRFLEEGLSDEQLLEQLTLAALSRRPTEAERARVLPILAQAPLPQNPADKAARDARRQAIEDLFWATLTGKEFLFNH